MNSSGGGRGKGGIGVGGARVGGRREREGRHTEVGGGRRGEGEVSSLLSQLWEISQSWAGGDRPLCLPADIKARSSATHRLSRQASNHLADSRPAGIGHS